MKTFLSMVLVGGLTLTLTSCGGDGEVDSEEAAELAYLGLDGVIEKSLQLGMKGYNEASSANIPAQSTGGDVAGTLNVTGQVDAGVSANKEMRLSLELIDYRDELPDPDVAIAYDTDAAALPLLELSLRNIPDGTFTGTLLGTIQMDGDLRGGVELNLTLSGDLEAGPDGQLQRVVGTTTVMGTATSEYGTYDVNVTL